MSYGPLCWLLYVGMIWAFEILICVLDSLRRSELKAKLQPFALSTDQVKYQKKIGQGAFGEVRSIRQGDRTDNRQNTL